MKTNETVRILERHVQGKYDDPERCEDGIFVNERYVAVIDGVTTKSSRRYQGKRSGRIAMEIIEKKLSVLSSDLNAEEFLNALSEAIQSFVVKESCKDNEIPRACVIAYSVQRKRIYAYGDCQYRMNGKTYSVHKRIDRMNENLRSYVISTALKQGMTIKEIEADDPGRKAIQPYLKTQYLYENEGGPFGYAVLNRQPVNPEMITDIPVPEGTEVILASDGYPLVKDTLTESEKVLAEMLRKDPLCYRLNPQTKGLQKDQLSYDDRSYIRFVTE